jgi:BirA family biotin operon repressor/biotin-[acetyl-CoA-carboxylase] ligase
MDQSMLVSRLADLYLPEVRYYDRIDSTNEEARRWIDQGAPDRGVVVANEQTAGRGRLGRRWITPPGTALAFSLVLRSPPFNPQNLTRLSGLAPLATRDAIRQQYSLPALVKWPNDVLINGRKLSGVLIEPCWIGEVLTAVIVGIGINIAPDSISTANLPSAQLNFPATCIESELGHPVDRLELLHAVLYECLVALPTLSQPAFIHRWEAALAFRGSWIELSSGMGDVITGKLVGLAQDGALRLLTGEGREVIVELGEMHQISMPTPAGSRP